MSANPPIAAEPRRPGAAHRFRWAIWVGAALAGLAIAAVIALVAGSRSSPAPASSSATTFAAGRAPGAGLLARRPARHAVLARLVPRPAGDRDVHRSALPRLLPARGERPDRGGGEARGAGPGDRLRQRQPLGRPPANFAADAVHWQLAPGWRWGTGSYGKLAAVWKDYDVGVSVTKKTVAGIPIRRIVHTGAAYLVDANGDERALWLYPFTTDDVVSTAKQPGYVTWLTKSEVNALYYNTVAGDIVFRTEASVGHHPAAAARLVAARARGVGLRTVRILEVGANDARFARELLRELRVLYEEGETELERIDYVAVDLARDSLERAATQEEELWVGRSVLRPTVAGSSMVALVVVEGGLAANLGLVHSEATRFVRENTRQFDVAILNELLDDMPYRAYFADAGGRRFEAVPLSRDEEGTGLSASRPTRPRGSSRPER